MDTASLVALTSTDGRRCPRRMPADWQPPVPAWMSDLDAAQSAVVCCFGVQSKRAQHESELRGLREHFARLAARVERAWYLDAQGYRNDVLVCYFGSPEAHGRAAAQLADWWESPARLDDGVGYWLETFTAPRSHRETLFSADDRPAGLAVLGRSMIGPVAEHGYWGGARDRIPASAHDELHATGRLRRTGRPTAGRRLRVEPNANLCIIRSGQDFTDCTGRELDLYKGRVEPVLVKGMEFLRDHPEETGCYSCRFMSELGEAGARTGRTFGLASFLSLAHLEQWAALHPTHLAIFVEFLAMAQELGPAMRLRLWHEVYVLPAGEGHRFEYLNCHPQTGLLPFLECEGC